MKWKFKIVFVLSIYFTIKMNAQNLVPNANFELYSTCPPGLATLCNGWFSGGTADYDNSCDLSNSYSVPINNIGYQNAHSGLGYVGIYCYNNSILAREYIEVKLNNPLLSGQKYYVSFFVSLGDTMRYAIEDIGALFTDTLFDPFPAPSYNWQTGIPQIVNTTGNMLNDKINWMQIKGSIVAIGGEEYITIGNFKNDAQTVKQNLGGSGSGNYGAYYYIDDVYVSEVPLGVYDEKITDFKLQIYPNPVKDELRIKNEEFRVKDASITIYDVLGNKVVQLKNYDASQTIDVHELPRGLYFVQLQNVKEIMNTKFVKE